jgi:hypothetical protein
VHRVVRLLQGVTREEGEKRSAGPSESGGEDILEPGARTTRRLRPSEYEEVDRSGRSNPLIWAAYIHVGP